MGKTTAFYEALQNGFAHIKEITDTVFLRQLRSEGIRVDDEGFYSYTFGEHKEYELRIEPIGEDGQYQVAVYKNGTLLTRKLPVWSKKS